MILQPPVLALLAASCLSALLMLPACVFALQLLLQWDPASGSERQIKLEKTTYLVSTQVAFVAAVELVSLAAFAFNADRMSALFVGAMCAVGTLNASVYGFPTLFAKIAVFFVTFIWLILDRTDACGRDYPFIRHKYFGILLLGPLIILESGLQLAYFVDLKTATITSCCGKLFGDSGREAGADIAGMNPKLALGLLIVGLSITIALAVFAPKSRLAARLLGLASPAAFVIAIAAVISVISVHVYEQPHHHCPFCLLKREYGYFGFMLYIPLFTATGTGMSAGLMAALPERASLAGPMPQLLRRLSLVTMLGLLAFGGLSLWAVTMSRLALT